MANTDKNIVITPNKGSASDPQIVFSGANANVGAQNITLSVYPASNGTVSFSGSAGELFSITNDLSNNIFSVNDISGIPSIDVYANGEVRLAPISGNVGIGNTAPTHKLSVTGTMNVSGNSNVGNLGTAGLITATGNITGGNVIATLHVGNLSGTGNSNVGNLGVTGIFATTLSASGNANVGNIGGTNGVFTNISGTLTTASQTGITAVGTIGNLSVSGTANVGAGISLGTSTALIGAGLAGSGTGGLLRLIGTTNAAYIQSGIYNTGNSAAPLIFTTITANREWMRLDANGNLGINTNSPTSTLHANGTANITGAATFGSTLSAAGNANVGNIGATNGVFTNISGTLTTGNQPNITAVGSLTSLSIDGNLIVGNNLFVNGNLTYLNVETVAVEDPIIQLQAGPNGAAPVANTGKDVGTALNYYDTAAKIAFMGWDTSNAEIALASNVSIANEVVTFTNLANVRAGNILTTGVFATTLSATGNANVGNIGATNGVFTNISGNGSALTGITANTANNIAGGTAGQIPVQTSANTTGFVANFTFSSNALTLGGNDGSITTLLGKALIIQTGSSDGSVINVGTGTLTIGVGESISNTAATIQSGNLTIIAGQLTGDQLNGAVGNAGSITISGGVASGNVRGNTNGPNAGHVLINGGDTFYYAQRTGNVVIRGGTGTIVQSGSWFGNNGPAGGNVLISGGDGPTVTTGTIVGNAGGIVTISGGNAKGTANNAGGNVIIRGGVSTGSGAPGNVLIGGNSNTIITVTGTGANIAGTLSVSGNANTGNIGATNGVFTNVNGTLTTAAQNNITSVGTLTSLSVSGNANIGNIGTAGLITATGNITGGNISTLGVLSVTGNANVGNLQVVTDITIGSGTGGNITGVDLLSTTTISASGNANIGNIGTAGIITATGNITGNYFFGNGSQLTGIVASTTTLLANGTSNVAIPTSGGNINFTIGGSTNEVVFTSTGANINGTLSTSGNANIANIGVGLITATGQIRTSTTLSVVGNANIGNIGTAGILTAGGNIITSSRVSAVGVSTSYGVTTGNSVGAFNGVMGTSSSATWLLSGTSGGVFRYGIQALDAGGILRFYEGANFMQFGSNSLSISGTATTANLSVGGAISMTGPGGIVLIGAGTGGTGTGGLLRLVGTSNVAYIQSGIYGTANSAAPLAFTTMINGREWMRLDENGNLGVNIAAPTSTIHVVGTANITGAATFSNTISATGNVTGNYFLGNGSQLTGIVAAGFTSNVGNASANSFTVTHNLNKQDIFVTVREYASGYLVYPDIKYSNANAIVLEFVSAPTANQYRVSVIGF